MFVRNNTTCPNCGDCNTFDLSTDSCEFPDMYTMHIECIKCNWGLTVDVSSEVMLPVITSVVKRWCGDLNDRLIPLMGKAYAPGNFKEQLWDGRIFVSEFSSLYLRKKNQANAYLTCDPTLGNVVSYFVSKPDRKRRYTSHHFLRTVGL